MRRNSICCSRNGWLWAVAGLVLWIGGATAALAGMQFHWVQLIKGSEQDGILRPSVVVRAIVDAKDKCTGLYTSEKMQKKDLAVPMHARHRVHTLDKHFSEIKVCEAYLRPDTHLLQGFHTVYLKDGNKAIELILPDLSKGIPLRQLVAYGCTGCRDNKAAQYCSDKDAKDAKKKAQPWYFKKMNNEAADRVGKGIPPMVVHLGDLRYAGQKDGVVDSWKKNDGKLGWKQEFFEPTKELLENSFSVVLRGNHEGCFVDGNEWNGTKWADRGEGWLYFFGTGNLTCEDVVGSTLHDVLSPFAMDAVVTDGSTAKPVASNAQARLVFMDMVRTGDTRDKQPDKTKELYQADYDEVNDRFVKDLPEAKPAWILSHIPAYGLKGAFDPNKVTDALQDSALFANIGKVSFMPVAHVHRFNLVRASDDGPFQMVVGNAGVALSGKAGDALCYEEDSSLGWKGIRTSNFGYLHASFTVGSGQQVTATYAAPFYKHKDMKLACSGSASHPMRLTCRNFPRMQKVTECKK